MAFSLNENIKRLRQARGMNQVDLAKALGVTKQCISNWENDNIIPSIEMLIKLADIFRVSTDYLLGREERTLLDVSRLTENQIGHISLIIDDLSTKDK